MRKTIALILMLLFVLGVFSFVACNDATSPAPDSVPDNDNTDNETNGGNDLRVEDYWIITRNELLESAEKTKWYNYMDYEYTFGDVDFATSGRAYWQNSYKYLPRGYDVAFSGEVNKAIDDNIETIYSQRGLSASTECEQAYVSFIDISENALAHWISIAESFYEDRTAEDVFREDFSRVSDYENERIKMEIDMTLSIESDKEYWGLFFLSSYFMGLGRKNGDLEYRFEFDYNKAYVFYVIWDKLTEQEFIFVISKDVSPEYATEVLESSAYAENKEATIKKECQGFYDILNPYINEIVDDYLIEEYGVEL